MNNIEIYEQEFNNFRDSVISKIEIITNKNNNLVKVNISMLSKNYEKSDWYEVVMKFSDCSTAIINSRKNWNQFIINQGLFIIRKESFFIVSDMDIHSDFDDDSFIMEQCRGFLFICGDIDFRKALYLSASTVNL